MYKSLPAYKELLQLGYYEVFSKRANKNTIIFSNDEEPDRRWFIQASGYVRTKLEGNSSYSVMHKFIVHDYERQGLTLLLTSLKYKKKMLNQAQSAEIIYKTKSYDEHDIIFWLFKFQYVYRFENFIKLMNKGKKYQALNSVLKEIM